MASRNYILFYINDQRFEISGALCFKTLSDFLRYEINKAGTKVVCAEGDCGACSVLLGRPQEMKDNRFVYKAVNSCILPLLSLDGCHIITVEGLKKEQELHPVQKAMVENFGSQCGYCTPGFVCAMTAMVEDSLLNKKGITEKRAKNYLTGNLCRCTGYTPILQAACSIDLKKTESLRDRYHNPKMISELKAVLKKPVEIIAEQIKLFLPVDLKSALHLKAKNSEARVIAGATDVGVAVNKGREKYQSLMSLQNISEMWKITRIKNNFVIPARVTLSQLQNLIETEIPHLGDMMHIFASPQIKNSGTLIGNLVNASPIADTIPFLMAADALVEVQSNKKKRLIPIEHFFLGYKKLDLKKDEIVTAVHIPKPQKNEISKLYKVSLRKDLDISAVTMATRILTKNGQITEARLVFGGVGPTVLRLHDIEKNWVGQKLEPALLKKASEDVHKYVSPLSDVRGSHEYRLTLCKNLLLKFSDEVLT